MLENKYLETYKFEGLAYIDTDPLCYIYLASFASPKDLSSESQYLFPLVILFKLVQKYNMYEIMNGP